MTFVRIPCREWNCRQATSFTALSLTSTSTFPCFNRRTRSHDLEVGVRRWFHINVLFEESNESKGRVTSLQHALILPTTRPRIWCIEPLLWKTVIAFWRARRVEPIADEISALAPPSAFTDSWCPTGCYDNCSLSSVSLVWYLNEDRVHSYQVGGRRISLHLPGTWTQNTSMSLQLDCSITYSQIANEKSFRVVINQRMQGRLVTC